MSEGTTIVVVGAGSLVGESLLRLLEDRSFAVDTLHLADRGDAVGNRVEFSGRYLTIQDLDEFDFSSVHLALFAAGEAVADAYVERAVAAGCLVVDQSPRYREIADVPLVLPGTNEEVLHGGLGRGVIALPSALGGAIATLLKPIHDAAQVVRVTATTLQAVSGAGREGVEELARQTANLLNMRPVEPALFSRQIAFNLLPLIGGIDEEGYSREETKIAGELRRLLGTEGLAVSITAVRVPVFFGHSAVLNVETSKAITPEEARAMISSLPGVRLLEGSGEDIPTPVTEAANDDSIWVARVRSDLSHPNGITLWLTFDNVRRGAAAALVGVAELLVKDFL